MEQNENHPRMLNLSANFGETFSHSSRELNQFFSVAPDSQEKDEETIIYGDLIIRPEEESDPSSPNSFCRLKNRIMRTLKRQNRSNLTLQELDRLSVELNNSNDMSFNDVAGVLDGLDQAKKENKKSSSFLDKIKKKIKKPA